MLRGHRPAMVKRQRLCAPWRCVAFAVLLCAGCASAQGAPRRTFPAALLLKPRTHAVRSLLCPVCPGRDAPHFLVVPPTLSCLAVYSPVEAALSLAACTPALSPLACPAFNRHASYCNIPPGPQAKQVELREPRQARGHLTAHGVGTGWGCTQCVAVCPPSPVC